MASKLTIQEKEELKIAIINHEALIRVINNLSTKDYPKFSTIKESVLNEELTSKYRKIQKQMEIVKGNSKLTFFDKVLCLIDSLKNTNVFYLSDSMKPSKKLKDANIQYIIQVLLLFLENSEYQIKAKRKYLISTNKFDYDGFSNGHKTEFNNMVKGLITEFRKDDFNYDDVLNLIIAIYQRGIVYKEEIDLDLENDVMKGLIVNESFSFQNTHSEYNPEYVQYRKSFRDMK